VGGEDATGAEDPVADTTIALGAASSVVLGDEENDAGKIVDAADNRRKTVRS